MIILCFIKLLRNNYFRVNQTIRFIPEFVCYFNRAIYTCTGKLKSYHFIVKHSAHKIFLCFYKTMPQGPQLIH
jgi:hypothetical protein